MKSNEKYIIALSVYNSYQNLQNILIDIKKSSFNNLIKKIIIVDNNSEETLTNKIKLIKYLSRKYKKKIKLIVNNKNYGLGGSQKILFNSLKKEKFTYLINAHTSGRYKIINQLKFIKKTKKYNYIIGSRFLNKEATKNYSLLRKTFNLFFIKLTRLATGCKLSDPGSAIYIVSKKLLFKIIPVANNLTDYSHFNHLLNAIIYKEDSFIFEFSMNWKEGNIKSHLNPINYIAILFLSLASFYFSKNFYKIKKVNFKFKTYLF